MEHKHHGKSSEKFLDCDEILSQFEFSGDETFMDAGCGDGHIAIKAISDYLPNGTVYAVDNYDAAIADLEEYKKQNNIHDLRNIRADITKTIPGVSDNSVDVVLMVNVFHGFKASDETDEVIGELARIIKDDGRIALVDFKPIEMPKGPPLEIRLSTVELEGLFDEYGFKKIYLNEEMGEDIAEGKSHYFIMFQKEN